MPSLRPVFTCFVLGAFVVFNFAKADDASASAAASNRRVKRDGHGHHHGHPGGSFGFHGFGAQHPPLIIEDTARSISTHGGQSSKYGYRPPSQSYGPPQSSHPGFVGDRGGAGFDGGAVCPVGCAPISSFGHGIAGDSRYEGVPSTHYGPPLPIYAAVGNEKYYPENYVDEEEEGDDYEEETEEEVTTKKPPKKPTKPKPKPTPKPTPAPPTKKPGKPSSKPKTTTPSSVDPDERTLPPFIDKSTLSLARTFGFEIVPGDGEPPTQEELEEILDLLPPGLSFSLLPMDLQDAFFAGDIEFKKIEAREKRRAQHQEALKARKEAAAASSASTSARS